MAILVASALVWAVLLAILATLFFAVLIPAVQFGGRNQIPADFPVYPNAHLESALASVSGRCTTVTATWSSSDSAATVFDFYRRELSAGDWTVNDATNSTEIFFQSASTPNREGYVAVLTQPYANRTYIELTMAKSEAGDRSVSGCHVLAGAAG